MNYIFLDIDGVMNNRIDWMSKVDNKLEQFHDHRMFCDKAWQLLSDVCEKTKAAVILSSTWRLGLTYDKDGKVIAEKADCHLSNKLIEYFNKYNINLIGITQKSWEHRGKQINNYVKNAFKLSDKFVVIDDEDFDIKRYVSKNQIIKTDFETGLLPEHCEKIINYFNK